jgi:hypothetical protein
MKSLMNSLALTLLVAAKMTSNEQEASLKVSDIEQSIDKGGLFFDAE